MSLIVSVRRVIMPAVVACVVVLTAQALPASADDIKLPCRPRTGRLARRGLR